ncbi:MAG: UvrD-helicase domain-containing protein [Bacteroidetes bacterium]|nr:UvrD-helicase domain-containing protein [Bacteroidota bacterium]MDA0888115.1 UvrD-helicase domain-containing protein [Bacteroidota bacterium]MDA1084067.1 UvrD-helicase domain-containing protein [Bacteroidota bacterium]
MENYLQLLNEAQQKPTVHKDGPLMVIAGAGSGKTRVLTYRIAYLMQQGVDSFSILALTFTNKAAREMKARIAQIVGESEAKNLWMGTFHSVFARILRSEADRLGYPSSFTIYDTQDSERLLASIIKELNLDKDLYKVKQIRSRISSFKNSLVTVRAYYNNPELIEADRESKRPEMGAIYKEYVDRCFKAGAMDFDDLLLKTNELLNRFPDVLAKYQERFRYILVDEYQDTNHSQYLIVRALADRYQNICVVGDDAQSIYAFRGANIQNILNFQRDYPDAGVYRLEQNYRSSGTIVKAANAIIAHNTNRLEKNVWTANPEGHKIIIHRSPTDGEEGRYVAGNIFERAMQSQLGYEDFAILYRTNAQSRAMEDSLRKRNIPYRVYGGVSFYQRKEIKDVLAYLRLLVNPNDEESLKRIINYPMRGIGQTTINKLIVAAKTHDRTLFEVLEKVQELPLNINAGTRAKLQDFHTMIVSFRVQLTTLDAFEMADMVTKKAGLVTELKKEGTPEAITRVENIEELLNGVKDFVDGQRELADATGSLVEFLEDVALATDFDNEVKDQKAVSLMTIHLAKGLEFPNVYIVGLEEDLFPSAMSVNTRAELEEERRLFYVALTRAEKRATLTYTLSRYRWGKIIDAEPSRFLTELDESCVDNQVVQDDYTFKPMIDASVFDAPDPNRVRFKSLQKKKTTAAVPPKARMKAVSKSSDAPASDLSEIKNGSRVSHSRFGFGTVVNLEGSGNDAKALIRFDQSGEKNLLLRFAKLKVIS